MTTQPSQNPQYPQSPQSPQSKAHSAAYYPLLVVAIILGIGIVVWIVSNAAGRVRIPYIVLVLPTLVLIGLVKMIDEALLRRQSRPDPNTSGPGATPGANPSNEPVASSYGIPAGPVGYGQPQQPQIPVSEYGRTQQPQAAESGPGDSGYGWQPTHGYGQTPPAEVRPPYGQDGSWGN